jgi:hypothetical protein
MHEHRGRGQYIVPLSDDWPDVIQVLAWRIVRQGTANERCAKHKGNGKERKAVFHAIPPEHRLPTGRALARPFSRRSPMKLVASEPV